MKIIQSRNQREGGYKGRRGHEGRAGFRTFHKRAGVWAPNNGTLRSRLKERKEWEKILREATPEERSVLIRSRAFNRMVERQDSFGEAFFPTTIIAP